MTFAPGDVVECIDDGQYNRIHNGQKYTIADPGERATQYIYLEEVTGGWLPTRFKFINSYNIPSGSSEYDEIILAQELYDKMEG